MRRSFTRGLLVTANYMWSHEIDNGSNGSGDGDEVIRRILCAWPAIPPAAPGTPAMWSMATRSISSPSAWASHAEPARDRQRHRRQLATDDKRRGPHRIPGECADASSYIAPDGATGTGASRPRPGVSLTPPGGRTVAEWINPAAFTTPEPENSAPRRATWFADRAPGRSIWAPPRHLLSRTQAIGIPLGVLQHFQSPATGSAAG